METEKSEENIPLAMTPTKNIKTALLSEQTPTEQTTKILKDQNTPRRSTRKSTRPIQEYNELVASKRVLRSHGLHTIEAENCQEENMTEELPRWTPSKVGRFSEKRSKRRKNKKQEQKDGGGDTHEQVSEEQQNAPTVLGTYAVSDDEENCTKGTLLVDPPPSSKRATKKLQITDSRNTPEEDVENHNEKNNSTDKNTSSTVNDTTFNTSGCSILSPDKSSKTAYTILGTYEVSDDEENCTKSTLLVDPPQSSKRATKKLQITDSRNTPDINRKRSSAYRVPTPYKKPETDDHIQATDEEMPEEENAQDEKIVVPLNLTTLEPKQIILRSIRKRSFSVGIDGADTEHQRRKLRAQNCRVTFHSPANQTLDISQLDELIAKNVYQSDHEDEMKHNNVKEIVAAAIVPRKRSLSCDDRRNQHFSRLPRPVFLQQKGTPNKNIITANRKPQLNNETRGRTKLPNFATIHQRNFDKMENVVDHVARKAERAKVLTSATKLLSSSLQKLSAATSSAMKLNSSARKVPYDVTGNSDKVKPKAMKKIELEGNDTIANISQLPNPKRLPIPTVNSVLITSSSKLHPRHVSKAKKRTEAGQIMKTSHSSLIASTSTSKTTSIMKTSVSNSKQTSKKATTTTAVGFGDSTSRFPQVKKPTTIGNKSTTFSAINKSTVVDKSISVASLNENKASIADIVAARRQRHMDMYKTRMDTRTAVRNTKIVDAIRGVRSNRRFELQMQHRRNLEQ